MGITNKKRHFGVFCGQWAGKEVNVTGSYVQLTFHSDKELQTKGFLLLFTSILLPSKWKTKTKMVIFLKKSVVKLLF